MKHLMPDGKLILKGKIICTQLTLLLDTSYTKIFDSYVQFWLLVHLTWLLN